MPASVDILIPTCNRPTALAVTLAALATQDYPSFRILVCDQSDGAASFATGEVATLVRLLQLRHHPVELFRNLPRRGMAHQRQVLLERATAPYVLFLDDDVILEPDLLGRLVKALEAADCGFVGSALIGLSFLNDVRPHQQHIEWWEGKVEPETVLPGSTAWQRYQLHNAANVYHLQQALQLDAADTRLYKVAWVGGCVLYQREKLLACGGFGFWQDLPREHCGEDVLAQLRVMARYGGAGLLPSGAYHQELPTTVQERKVNAPEALQSRYLATVERHV